MTKKTLLICLSFFSVLLSAKSYGQAFDLVIRIDGIPGESKIVGHTGEIDVFSYSDGISSCIPNTSNNKTACKAVAAQLNMMTQFDKATIPLKMATAKGKIIPSADMTFIRPAGGKRFEFYKIHMENVAVVAVQESGSQGGDSRPTVSISLSYSRIAWQYTVQSADGGPGEKVSDGWDFVLSKQFVYTFQ